MDDDSHAADVDFVAKHFSPADTRLVGQGPLLADGQEDSIALLLEKCPIARTDAQFIGSPDGSWIVSSYRDVMSVLQQPAVYSSKVQHGLRDDERELIPFNVDPPLLLEYRRFLQPFFTLKAAEPFEPIARTLVTKYIDQFISSGTCQDAVTLFAQPFASEVQWRWLLGVDLDHDQLLDWMLTWLNKHFEPEFADAEKAWVEWILETVDQRRSEPRRADLIDALLHNQMSGRLLTDDEIVGVVMLMILGGVPATQDAITNTLLRLAVYPDLQDTLRDDLSLLPRAIEELLRLDSPSSGSFRRCTRDTQLGGQEIQGGDQLFWFIGAANRDPEVFENANSFDLERDKNPHLAFGAGHHRCLGATFARQNIRVALEEILTRMHDIRLIPDDPPKRKAAIAWGLERLPIRFTAAS